MIDHDTLDKLSWANGIARAEVATELGTVYVPGEGENPQAIIIGEAPGAVEEIKRRPFVGKSGLVLRQLMLTARLSTGFAPDLSREGNCWLTNVVKFRPHRNRDPYWIEVQKFRPLLRAEWIAIGKPRIVIPVGGIALKALSGKPHASILKHAGRMFTVKSRVDGRTLYIWPMLHPAFGLRNKGAREQMEEDWLRLGEWL